MRRALGLGIVLIAACPSSRPAPKQPEDPVAAEAKTCDDVRATAVRLNVVSELEPVRRPPSTLFGQAAPVDEDDPGEVWYDECVRFAWSQAKIDCFTGAASDDDARTCAQDTAEPVAAEPEELDCASAADRAAITLASDVGSPGDAEVIARAREAFVDPCNTIGFSDWLLRCLHDTTANVVSVCEEVAGDDDAKRIIEWTSVTNSLDDAGFAAGKSTGSGWF